VVEFDYALHRVYNLNPLKCSPARLALVGDPPKLHDPREGSEGRISNMHAILGLDNLHDSAPSKQIIGLGPILIGLLFILPLKTILI